MADVVDVESITTFPDLAYLSEERQKYLYQYQPLYRAILKNDWTAAEEVIDKYPSVLRDYISEGKETALHIAALSKDVNFVKKIVEKMDAQDMEIQNGQGNTALCFAAVDGNVRIAELMIAKNSRLPNLHGPQGVKPIDMAASLGQKEMVKYLHPLSTVVNWSIDEKATLLTTCIASGLYGEYHNFIFIWPSIEKLQYWYSIYQKSCFVFLKSDAAFRMVHNDSTLAAAKDGNGLTALHVLARLSSSFNGVHQEGLWRRIIKSSYLRVKEENEEQSQQVYAHKLVYFILDHILLNEDCEISSLVEDVPTLLFEAAEVGNTEFVIALIDYYPDLIWQENYRNQSIFHIAISHRHQKIFNLIHEIGSIGSLLATRKDKIDGNNMLHLAATLAPQEKLNKVSGAALQMQRDLLWYMEVQSIVGPSYRVMKNKDAQTPHDIFKETHKGLMKDGEKWMKSTSSSCLVVATLIATVVFTAAFTVPGGVDTSVGVPVLLDEPFFKVFAISEGIGMFASSTSILMLLSILTSRYQEKDFLHSLPLMLMLAITTLFLSIAAMIIAFCTTLFLSFEDGATLLPILLGVFACIPIMSFLIKFPLLVDIICSTYDSRFLFRSNNRLFQRKRRIY
nr:PREDICTED: ankyrin repeat-containing protein At5g02620-like isoform X2 [Daucus carota subsp. sativus]